MRPKLLLVVAALAAAHRIYAQTPAGFLPGDLYQYSNKLHDGVDFYGIARIDPLTGGTTTLVKMFGGGTNLVYDPARDRLAFYGRLAVVPNNQLHFLDASGTFTSTLTLSFTPRSLSPGKNGKLYIATPTGPNGIRWLALDNTVTSLKDAAGTADFTYGGAAFDYVHYDHATNALFLLQQSAATTCGQPTFNTYKVVKVPLSEDGTKVGGAIVESQFCLGVYGLTPTGLCRGPQGRLLAFFDKNDFAAAPLVQWIDTNTLAVGAFATPVFPFDNSIAGGTYSQLLGRAVLIDTSANVARSYGFGETGGGSVLVTANANPMVSAPGSIGDGSEMCTIDIDGAGLATYGAGKPGCAGPHALSALFAPKANVPGFRFTCTLAPPTASGLLLFGNAPDFAGTDALYAGVPLYFDLFLSTDVVALDLSSDALGSAATAPLTLPAAAIGLTYYGNAFWLWQSCSIPPFHLSATHGLAVTIQP